MNSKRQIVLLVLILSCLLSFILVRAANKTKRGLFG